MPKNYLKTSQQNHGAKTVMWVYDGLPATSGILLLNGLNGERCEWTTDGQRKVYSVTERAIILARRRLSVARTTTPSHWWTTSVPLFVRETQRVRAQPS